MRDADPRQTVIETVWDDIVLAFAAQGLHHPAKARLEMDPARHDSCRHFAATTMDGSVVYVAPELADMPYGTLLGILAHEAGHVEDLRSPGIWWFRGGKLKRAEGIPSRGARKHLAAWQERSNDEVERVADALGELAIDQKIGYVGQPGCLVQFVGEGVRRPKGLK